MSNMKQVQNNKNRNGLMGTISSRTTGNQPVCAHTPAPHPQSSEVTPSPHTATMTMQAPDLL